ncbi:XdhC family protein [Comamonas endophytica]|uniref:XdhC family protein n=1 Tax=Comamonas endophytica TaxID=2949090 RepID=A0ABY6G6V3_9BURK|nr:MULTISPECIES: XdhC family protein [unclassified Acidovorax]MCD2512414.1 XdhC family protein [Acidovorax sp. D4N7]UYG50140.1 XdhC family protein [Acidovorax sp. 5MLIR]
MNHIDITVLQQLQRWRAQGLHAVLATVVRTWGSSPRPVGAMMALCENGQTVGSVSGGCIEDDLLQRYTHLGEQMDHALGWAQPPQRVTYGVTADEAHRFGLPCGGTLELVLEFDPDAGALEQLTSQLLGGALVCRSVDLGTGQVTLTEAEAPQAPGIDTQALHNVLGPGYRMLLIGAGTLSEYLATMAIFNGFVVTICDPRQEYMDSLQIQGVQRCALMPDDAVTDFKPDLRSCVIALSHDPKLDDLALLEALQSPAFYVGAIGSRRNARSRRERMQEHFDVAPETLARLHSPAGLSIGSKTPAEIAVSIMAQVIARKNGNVTGLPEGQVGQAAPLDLR